MFGRGGHHGHVTRTICMNCGLPPIMFFIDPENVFWQKSTITIYCGTAPFWFVEINSTNQKIYWHLPNNMEVPRGGGGVCASLIPENNALISPNPWKKIPQLPESIFPFSPNP